MSGDGDFVTFFRPEGWSFALKSCSWGGNFDEKKIRGPGVSLGEWQWDGNRLS